MDKGFAGRTGYRRIVDDVIIYNSDVTQHAKHVGQFLQRCAKRKIPLNTDKWQFTQTAVNFAGFTLSAKGYYVNQFITEAISNFPTPVNKTDLCAFFGLVNQLSGSTTIVAGLLAPLRLLLSTKNEFTW